MKTLLILIWISIQLQEVSAQDVPYFRILAPQFLCNSKNNNSEFIPPSSITIALQTRASQKLTYKVQVYFKLLDGFQSQRHTLSVWRSIRLLEKRLRVQKGDISLRNQIDILNEELTPGVEYTFSIVGIDNDGNVSPEQNFTITYRGADAIGFDQESGSSGADVSFLLVGTWNVYRNMPFLLQGVIIFCDPIPYYEFYWTMNGLREKPLKYLNSRSKTLYIPADLLTTGTAYNIAVEVKNKNSVLAKASGTLKIIERDFRIQLVPNNQSIGLHREVRYTFHVDNYEPNEDKIEVSWECNSNSSSSDYQLKVQEDLLTVSVSFFKIGLYELNVSVTLNGVTKSDSAFLDVVGQIITSVEVLSIKPFDVVAEKSFVAQFRINYLIPQCEAEWYPVGDNVEYKYLDTSGLEKGLGRMTMHDLEENFLSELIEYENDTTSYDLALTVPEENEGFTGFHGSTPYLFRLFILCPAAFDDDPEKNSTVKQNVTSYMDLILLANEPPFVEPLDVSPRNGTALKTLFKFSTAPAIDSPSDYPMRYKFYYRVEDFWVLVGDFYENTVTSTELPFVKGGTPTKYEVCDSRNACTTVEGPTIVVEANEMITENELKNKLNALEGSRLRKDYKEFFERTVCLLWSVSSGQFKKVCDSAGALLLKEVDGFSGDEFRKMYGDQAFGELVDEWKILAVKMENQELLSKVENILK